MSARTNLDAFGRNFNSLCHQAIGLFKKRFRVDHHAIAEHAGLTRVNNSRRKQMQYERLVAHLHGVAGVMAALIASNNVEVFGQKVNDLPFALITPLRTDDYNDFGHVNEVNSKQQTVNSTKRLFETLQDRPIREQWAFGSAACCLLSKVRTENLRRGCAGNVFVDHARDSVFGSCADDALFLLAAFEKN